MNQLFRIKTPLYFSVLFIFLLSSVNASAGMVIVSSDSNIEENTSFFDSIFDGEDVYSRFGALHSFATSNWAGTATRAASSYDGAQFLADSVLDGMDWLIAGSASLYSGDELDAIDQFVVGGGSLWVVGEGTHYSEINETANQLLSYIGSSMSVSTDQVSSYAYTAEGVGLTASLPQQQWKGNYGGSVLGGSALYQSRDGVVLAFTSTSTVAPVPVPGSLLLFGVALLGLGAIKRKKA